MPRLIVVGVSLLALVMVGCQRHSADHGASQKPSDLPSLLKAHDREVVDHGQDIEFIAPIGRYGRKGVVASLDHIAAAGKTVSSYNGMELVFGVAEEARKQTGYDLCTDRATLDRLAATAKASSAPPYEHSIFDDLLKGYCK